MLKTYKNADAGHRVCTICGKVGKGEIVGATALLRSLGYDVPLSNADHPAQAHAHFKCLNKAKAKHRSEQRSS